MVERTENDNQRTHNSQNNDGHVAEIQETSPLLSSSRRRSKYCDKVMLIGLAIMLIVGFIIGAYLLCVEVQDDVPEKFFYVPRADWSIQPDALNISKLVLPTRRLLILQTNTDKCWNSAECMRNLRRIERKQMEKFNQPIILYNFILGSDERVYEGRGWTYSSTFRDDNEDILTVAFLGNYDGVPPSRQQQGELKAFLDYSIMNNNLVPCFQILVRNSTSRYLQDLAFAIEEQEKQENGC